MEGLQKVSIGSTTASELRTALGTILTFERAGIRTSSPARSRRPPSRRSRGASSVSEQAPPVRARGLVKRYDDVLAVDHIDLNVNAGDVYGFLGPNGAGKTTTLRMILGLITPTEGRAELFGLRPDA